MQAARYMFVRALPASLQNLVPASSTRVPAGTALFMDTDPMPLAFGSVVYRMEMSAFTQTDTFGVPPTFEVSLARLSASGGQITGEQEHAYAYSATGMGMTATQGLTRLHLNTHKSVMPTRVNMLFTPTQAQSFKCTLPSGGTGIATNAAGTLNAKTFRIATGTSPIFGTITTAPTRAFAFDDPGCVSPGGAGPLLPSAAIYGAYHPTCVGRETIQAGNQFAQTSWLAEVGFGGRNAALFVQTSSTSVSRVQDHLAIGVESASDLPLAHHTESGATAVIQTEGNPLFGGSSFFFSHHPPTVSRVKTCTYEGHLHRFVATRYTGGMINTAGAPLAALFDTGTMDFVPRDAALTLRHYLS